MKDLLSLQQDLAAYKSQLAALQGNDAESNTRHAVAANLIKTVKAIQSVGGAQ